MPDKQWTMNCILAGVRVCRRLAMEDEEAAKLILRDLTSELEPEDIEYLISRIRNMFG